MKASSDQAELLRDLSTYECNLADSMSLQTNLKAIQEKIAKARILLRLNVKNDANGNSYFTQDDLTEDDFMNDLIEVKQK